MFLVFVPTAGAKKELAMMRLFFFFKLKKLKQKIWGEGTVKIPYSVETNFSRKTRSKNLGMLLAIFWKTALKSVNEEM